VERSLIGQLTLAAVSFPISEWIVKTPPDRDVLSSWNLGYGAVSEELLPGGVLPVFSSPFVEMLLYYDRSRDNTLNRRVSDDR
jgi:hypothetical protein